MHKNAWSKNAKFENVINIGRHWLDPPIKPIQANVENIMKKRDIE